MNSSWICPLCQDTLVFNAPEKLWACANSHTFDCAKEGYVNLLPSNKKHSSQPGDNTEMITARRQIHTADVYRPMANAVLSELPEKGNATSILDIGCGEGYYSQALQQAMPAAQVSGVDISKVAIRLAAKQNPGINFAVASTFDLPVASASQSVVVRIFAPSEDSEVIRVLEPGGFYLEVTPAPRHLWALREELYGMPRAHEDSRMSIPYLQLRDSAHCEFELELEQPLFHALLAMTPFAHRGNPVKRESLQKRDGMKLGFEFTLRLFQKSSLA